MSNSKECKMSMVSKMSKTSKSKKTSSSSREKREPLLAYLKRARSKAGLSQREVSNALGYSTAQFISNWERGVSTPPVSGLYRIARVYGIPAEELFDQLIAQVLEDVRSQMTLEFREARKG